MNVDPVPRTEVKPASEYQVNVPNPPDAVIAFGVTVEQYSASAPATGAAGIGLTTIVCEPFAPFVHVLPSVMFVMM